MPAKKRPARDLIPAGGIERRIFSFRGHRVMLDRDLAELYGCELKRLNEQVKRNRDRFPEDFMFQLTLTEGKAVIRLRSQIATLKRGQHLKYRPYVFTEHGAVMLANVLRSAVAVRTSIQVVRAFVSLRRMLANHEDLAKKIDALERKVGRHDADLHSILQMLKDLVEPPPAPARRPIGFRTAPVPARNV